MRKLYMLLASAMLSIPTFAQWTKPDLPTAQALSVGDECYLLNIDAGGFLVGANEWGTRASYDPTHGHKIYIQKFESEDDEVTWDGESYFITNYVEQGGSAGKIMAMDFSSTTDIWMDRAISATATNQGFMFEDMGDNIYKIGFAKVNEEAYSYEGAWSGAYLGGIPEMNDTRLYVCLPGGGTGYSEDNYQLRWIFVTPEDYTTYTEALTLYNAAVSLGEAIETAKAENEGIDLSEVEAVYNNYSSTTDELTTAEERTTELVIAFQTETASATTPANYTPLITNADYDDGTNDGWSGTSATVSYGVAEIYSWSANTFDYYQTISSLPAGVYRVGVTGYYRSGTNAVDEENYINGNDTRYVSLYATSDVQTTTALLPLQNSGYSSTALGGSTYQSSLGYVPNSMEAANIYFEAGQYAATQTLVAVDSEGTLTIGLQKTESATDNWAIWDNWTLEYLGAESDAYQLLAQQTVDAATDYETLVGNGSVEFYDHNAYDAYLTAKNTLLAASDGDAVASAITTFEEALATLETSIEAYSTFNTTYQEAEDWLTTQAADTDEATALSEYLNEAIDMLYNGEMTAEEITAQNDTLSELYYNAKASGMSDGDDCTSFLVNADFTASGGWTSAVGPTWPTEELPVGEAQNMLCDVYQELTGLQNGLYEFTTYDIYRTSDASSVTGDEDFKAYIYINSYKKKMNGLLDGQSETSLYSDDYQLSSGNYVPNSVAGVNAYFNAGLYKQTVYGLVTDGTMRIGYCNNLRYADGSRTWWGPATLIFRAKNEDALREATDMSLAEAEEQLTYICGLPEINALNDAIAVASDATGDDIYDALVSLKAAMADVDTCTTAYSNLLVALANLEDAIATVEMSDETKADAQSTLDEANASYDARSLSCAEAEELTETINSLVVSLKLDTDDSGSLEDPQDVSSLIVNNTFDPSRGDKSTSTIDGWTTSALNGYKEYTCSYNRATIDLYQDLTGLPEGTYKVTVHTYYRAGYWYDEEEHINNGEETHLTTLYAQTTDNEYTTPVMNLTEGATTTLPASVSYYTLSSGLYAPDGTSASAAYFSAGYYLNELPFYVGDDGKVRIGLSKTEIYANDYEVVGEWNLYYYGTGDNVDKVTGIESLEGSEAGNTVSAVSAGIYNLQGQRIQRLQRGLNIIKMSDGSVSKIIVK